MRRTSSLAWCIIVLSLAYSQVNAASSNQRSTTTTATTTQRILKTQAELDTLFFDTDDEESSQDNHDHHDTSSPAEQEEITEESAETEGSSSTRCVALTECTLCGVGAGDEEACDTTGRHQLFECAVVRGKEKRHDMYKSCSRTASDEQFLLIRMQLLCVTLGCIALTNARKQKMKNSSLFDQRRRRNNNVVVVPNTHATTAGSESKIKYTPLKSEEIVIGGGRDVHEGGDGDLV